MVIPSQSEIGLPVLELLSEGKLLHYDKIEKKLAEILELTEDEQNEKKSSGNERLLHNRVRWSIFYLAKAGLVKRPKTAHAKISEKGARFLKTNPEKINYSILNNLSKSFPDFTDS